MEISGSGLSGGCPMSDGEDKSLDDLPLPPPPPGLVMPAPPPPPNLDIPDIPALPTPPPPPGIAMPESLEVESDFSMPAVEEDSDDFNSAWERKKGENPTLSSDNRDRMYGHIDRIATGEVGTLLDRFSDRFGSELDREIIVLRKKQQQEMRDIKPTVELISAPEEEYVDDPEDKEDEEVHSDSIEATEEVHSDDEFPTFFNVVNDLLGGMPDEFVNSFVASDDFAIFQSVGADPTSTDEETRADFFQMINRVLGELPDDKINEFVQSPEFGLFQAMGEIYGA